MTNAKKKVVAVLSDLMFTVKIQEAAKRAGLDAIFVKSREDGMAQAKQKPAVLILDLNSSSVDALELIGALKADSATSNVILCAIVLDLIGYVSHVQAEL